MLRIKQLSMCILVLGMSVFAGCLWQADVTDSPGVNQTADSNEYWTQEQTTQSFTNEEQMVIPETIGCPYENSFGNNDDAKNAWDMIIYDGKLFLGSGDGDRNSGSKIACYDLAGQTWVLQKVPDEEINNFCIIGERLVAPGIDPTADWSAGNYYLFDNGEWDTIRTIPGGVHNFSMVEHDGLIFAGLGVLEGQTPVAVSSDGGKSFKQVPCYKDGEPWRVQNSDNDRAYDLFVLNDCVYAVIGSEKCVFAYEGDCFIYKTKWQNQIEYQSGLGVPRSNFFEAVTYRDVLYFSTGYLFCAKDPATPTFISMEGNHVWDLYVDNDTLYALTSRKGETGRYICSVFTVDEDGQELLFCFEEEIPARSFAVSGSEFYFSLLYRSSVSKERSGCVLKYVME